jgi:hypothetical protein
MTATVRTRSARAGRTAATAALTVLLAMPLVCAQDRRPEVKPAEGEETEPRNELALVVAGTRDTEENETFATLGLEYERRISEQASVVAEVEYLFDADRWIVVAPVVFRPARGVKLFAGPGFEHVDEAGDGATRFLFRIGGGYTFELAERYAIGPTLSLDLVREEGRWVRAAVVGVSVGFGF